ncbi:MAG: ChbG/HpnK family deacetylase [Candidatus Omnitrophica bacterium]|nr:ChbG/HpnK family deacetylase [Candidatus Omnitrophota bacterium]
MKILIINADDTGLSGDINEAVSRCFRAGVITGSSITPCGRYFHHGADMLRVDGAARAGVHLTLTGGLEPVTADRSRVRSLLTPEGRFPRGYVDIARKALTGKLVLSELREELSSQIEAVKACGLEVTHLDAHEHVHMFPVVLDCVVDLAVKYDIPYIRVPLERFSVAGMDFRFRDILRYGVLRYFAGKGMRTVNCLGIGHNDGFFGHFHSGRITGPLLKRFLSGMPAGITELPVHPGILSEELLGESPWHRNAEKEMNVLLEGSWMDTARREGVRVLSHTQALELAG